MFVICFRTCSCRSAGSNRFKQFMQTKATPHVDFGKPVNMFLQKSPPHETQTFGTFFIVEPANGLLQTTQFFIRISLAHISFSFSMACVEDIIHRAPLAFITIPFTPSSTA